MKKKKLVVGIVGVLVTAFAGLIYGTCGKLEVGGLAFDNIEALSNSEGVEISCGSMEHKGKCWRENYFNLRFCGEYSYYECEFTGMQAFYCYQPC